MVPTVAATGKGVRVERSKFWQRPLKDGRVETYVSVEGHFIHLWADSSTTHGILELFEETTGIKLPVTVERKPALFGRRRLRGQLAAQEVLF